jgi:hypothetical protein
MKEITIRVPDNASNEDVITELLAPYFVGVKEDENLVSVFDTEEQYVEDKSIDIHDVNWWKSKFNDDGMNVRYIEEGK